MPRHVLGLDVSTSCTGLCILDADVTPDDKGSHIVVLDHIGFKGCDGFFEKADRIHSELSRYASQLSSPLTLFALEEPLLGFSKGMSSAATITTLMRFNGITSYIGRSIFGIDPTYIPAASARKACGVKLQKTSTAGMSHKEQVFKHMMTHDLSHVSWPLKKSGQPIDASRDMTDAYVIARAACIIEPQVSSKK